MIINLAFQTTVILKNNYNLFPILTCFGLSNSWEVFFFFGSAMGKTTTWPVEKSCNKSPVDTPDLSPLNLAVVIRHMVSIVPNTWYALKESWKNGVGILLSIRLNHFRGFFSIRAFRNERKIIFEVSERFKHTHD